MNHFWFLRVHLVQSKGSSSLESRAAQMMSSGIRTPTLLRNAQLMAAFPPAVVHCFGRSLLAVRINVYCTVPIGTRRISVSIDLYWKSTHPLITAEQPSRTKLSKTKGFNVCPIYTISISLHEIINVVSMGLKLYLVHYLMSRKK